MIPIRTYDGSSWNQVDCRWYLYEIQAIYIQKRTLKKWYDALKKKLPAYIERESDRKSYHASEAIRLWEPFLKKSIVKEILDQNPIYEKSLPSQKKPLTYTESLFLTRYEVLYQIFKKLNEAEENPNLIIIGQQMIEMYEKMIRRKTNIKILENHHVRICPYCGCNLIGPRMNAKTAANLDHFFPKNTGMNGIFSLCLFNLIPVCPACNQIKGEKKLYISAYDKSCTNHDVIYKWRLYDYKKDASDSSKEIPLDELIKSPITALTKENIELLLVDNCEKDKKLLSNENKECIFMHGYGEDVQVIGLTDEDKNVSRTKYRKENEEEVEAVQIPYFSDLVAEEMRFFYKHRNLSQLNMDFPEFRFSNIHRYSEQDYLQYPNSKLYHDIYAQLPYL